MPSSIRKALNELPVTLDDTYDRILQNIPKQKWQHAHRLFQCMVAAIRPLRVEELAEIFAIGFGPNATFSLVEDWRPENPEEAVFSACSTLITITIDSDAEGSKIVQFLHFSVKEYLTSDRLQVSEVATIRNFYISLEPAHTILVRACLTVLLQMKRADREQIAAFPLSLYAAQNWVDHANFENVASHIQNAMEDLFNTRKLHLLTWIQIHNVDKFKIPIYEYSPTFALYYAASCGFHGLARTLIITHALDVSRKIYVGLTPLDAASRGGHVEVARVLLDNGADVNTCDILNNTPLFRASNRGDVKFVQLLLEHGANVDIQTKPACWTPLYTASYEGRLEIARLLLDHGADVQIQTNNGSTPFKVATLMGHHDIAQLLLDRGAERE